MLSTNNIIRNSLAVFLAAIVTPASAADGFFNSVSLEAGAGSEVHMVRLAGQSQWEKQWFKSNGSHLSGYWDLSVAYWRGTAYRNVKGDHQDIADIGFTPVFRYQADSKQGWYAEGGIGLHLLSKRYDNDDNRLSTHFQFGDHLGAGYVAGKWDIGLKLQHFSNGGYKKPNSGANFFVLKAARSF
ncbi:acyloxyacyl hydrolase [Massilia cavernae]|uniref:Lipid A deacylase n=1 Tax=Massilia cavernae TaxID=2320864 RepID=A0A418XFE5_9BURK|nr:acyloxyacyl hydrolase [Massilia cavernae]RJG11175.1 acyloxyacyl hydrolase [Massilia cavernae]